MICKKCNTDKPKEEFYVSSGYTCKECIKVRVRENRQEKIDYYRSYDRSRSDLPHRIRARQSYYEEKRQDPEAIKRWNEAKKRWRHSNKDKQAAHSMVNNAIRDGFMKALPCEICGTEKTEAHHPDYEYPLTVRWLCKKCHVNEHNRERLQHEYCY